MRRVFYAAAACCLFAAFAWAHAWWLPFVAWPICIATFAAAVRARSFVLGGSIALQLAVAAGACAPRNERVIRLPLPGGGALYEHRYVLAGLVDPYFGHDLYLRPPWSLRLISLGESRIDFHCPNAVWESGTAKGPRVIIVRLDHRPGTSSDCPADFVFPPSSAQSVAIIAPHAASRIWRVFEDRPTFDERLFLRSLLAEGSKAGDAGIRDWYVDYCASPSSCPGYVIAEVDFEQDLLVKTLSNPSAPGPYPEKLFSSIRKGYPIFDPERTLAADPTATPLPFPDDVRLSLILVRLPWAEVKRGRQNHSLTYDRKGLCDCLSHPGGDCPCDWSRMQAAYPGMEIVGTSEGSVPPGELVGLPYDPSWPPRFHNLTVRGIGGDPNPGFLAMSLTPATRTLVPLDEWIELASDEGREPSRDSLLVLAARFTRSSQSR